MAHSLPALTGKNNVSLELNLVQPQCINRTPRSDPHESSGSPRLLACAPVTQTWMPPGKAAVLVTHVSSHEPIYKASPGGGYGDTCNAHSKPLSPCQRQSRLVSAKCQKKLRMLPVTPGSERQGQQAHIAFSKVPCPQKEQHWYQQSLADDRGRPSTTVGRSSAEDPMAGRGSEDSLDPSLRRSRRSLLQRSSCQYSSHDFRGAACLGWKGRNIGAVALQLPVLVSAWQHCCQVF